MSFVSLLLFLWVIFQPNFRYWQRHTHRRILNTHTETVVLCVWEIISEQSWHLLCVSYSVTCWCQPLRVSLSLSLFLNRCHSLYRCTHSTAAACSIDSISSVYATNTVIVCVVETVATAHFQSTLIWINSYDASGAFAYWFCWVRCCCWCCCWFSFWSVVKSRVSYRKWLNSQNLTPPLFSYISYMASVCGPRDLVFSSSYQSFRTCIVHTARIM